jgi:glucose/arabinose dehydrogenase
MIKSLLLSPAKLFLNIKVICLLLLAIVSFKLQSQAFPPGFSQVKVATIYYPTSLAFAPDGRIFVTEKAGKIKIIKNGVVLSTLFAQVNVDMLHERGLSSVAIDPNFNTNHYVYVYYTTASSPIHNRLSRFTANGDVAVAGSESTIMDFEPSVNAIHNGGGMAFGPDGKLYIAIGNDNVNANSQDLSNYKGKVLRMNPDGSVPSGNPFSGSESAKRIWAYGLRNPWTIDIQPGTGKIFVNDVGEGSWEEINDATSPGRNFGWPAAEGNSSNSAYTNPVYTYHHGSSGTDYGCAITGGVFYNPASSNYPSAYTGKYFFIDYCNHWINYIDHTGTVQKFNFATGLPNSCNYLKVSNDGNLYYFSIGETSLYKIIYSNNSAPAITGQPASQSVSQGQNVTFSVTASGAAPLAYQWKKGGVNISGATSASYTITNVQYSHAGQYSVNVSNSYGSALSNAATLTVTAFNAQPVATILNPPSGTLYRSGDIINFNGDGSDAEDGTLPASAFNWYVEFHHDAHVHPGPDIPAGVKSGSFSTTFGEASANVYFRVFLVVNDSHGLTDTAFVDIHPVTSTLSFLSQPAGLQILLDGQPHTTPYSVLAVSGMTRSLNVTSPQTLSGTSYAFDHWSQGGAASQNITVTDNNQSFTAFFNSNGVACSGTGTISRDFWSNISGSSLSYVPFNTSPTSTSELSSFEGPTNSADNYGSRIRGYICAPVSGAYTFWIASDDNSELWLSTSSNPSGKVKIASVSGWTYPREWTKYPTQQSGSINLTAGTKYYIEAIHKEGTQGDHLSVGWKLPNGTLEQPIPGIRLSPYSAPAGTAPVVSITSPANNSTFSNPSNITINANASSSSGSISKVEFYENSAKIGEDFTSPYSITWTDVPTGNYALQAKAIDNTGLSTTSATINIIVGTCPTPLITANGPTTMCSGSVTLKTNYVSGNLYQWKKDGVDISGATSYSYTASSTGSYQVKVIQGSCVSWSAPTKVSIGNTLKATITAGGPTTFCTGGSVKLYANTCSDYTYQWKKDGSSIPGATASTYTAYTAGSYQVKVTLSGSSAYSSLVNVTVSACREVDSLRENTEPEPMAIAPDPPLKFELKVYPNPTSGLFTIMLNIPSEINELVRMRIVNMLGQEVYHKEIQSNEDYVRQTVELDNSLQTGIYTLQVTIGNRTENTNLVLAK